MAPKHLECDQCNMTFTNESDHEAHLSTHVKTDSEENDSSEHICITPDLGHENSEITETVVKTKNAEVSVTPNSFLESIRGKIRGKLAVAILPDVEVVIKEEDTDFDVEHSKPNEQTSQSAEENTEQMDAVVRLSEEMDDSLMARRPPVPKLVTIHEARILQMQNNTYDDSSTSTRDKSTRERKHQCGMCKKTFLRKNDLVRHETITCTFEPTHFHKCEECGKTYKRKDTLKAHMRVHQGEPRQNRKRNYVCEYCNVRFHGESLLRIHVRKHTGERPFECEFCEKAFPSITRLNYHRRVHTGEKPYSCKICQRRFGMGNALRKHMLLHAEGSKPYKCMFCDKEFNQSCGLKAHIFYHTGENGFDCKECGRVFSRKAVLQKHYSNVHQNLRPFECTSCNKCFANKADVERHMVTHTKERRHRCSVCQKAFSTKSSLTIHARIHKKEQPCTCKLCGRPFIRADCLTRHMKKRHPNEHSEIVP